MAWSRIEHQVIEALSGLGLAAGSRLLLLSAPGSRWPAALEEAGFEAVRHDAAEPLPPVEHRFAGAVVAGVLEENEWDRWILQQAGARLEPEAPVVIVARNLTSLAGPGDAAWLAGRIAREATPRILRLAGFGRTASPRRFTERRYSASRLRGLLGALGFTIERFDSAGAGWSAPLAALAPGQARALARFWVVVARTPRMGVLGGSVPLPPCREHIPAFEREATQFLANRETWAWQHPKIVTREPRELEPRDYAGATVLVLAPHPDDEIIGCGGTLLRLAGAGARVVVVHATDGSDSHALRNAPEEMRRSVRLVEARGVAALAGVADTQFWRADNRDFRLSPELVERATEILRRERPRLIFTSFLTDIHPDHLTANRILGAAIEAAGDALADSLVLGYEVWALAPPSLVCDVTSVREKQEALLWAYTTAMKVDDFIAHCERRNYYNSCRLLGRPGYAEVFHSVSAREYPALVTEGVRR